VIYLDHNATTPLLPEVAEHLARAFRGAVDAPGNPSSVHEGGRRARARLDVARARAAEVLGCEPREICFTASGSEADALALKGAWAVRPDRRRTRVVISSIEHPAVLLAAEQIETQGATIVRVPPERDGRVGVERFVDALAPDTALASLMWANNETGVLQPVREVARACHERGIIFHTDAVQAAGKVRVTLGEVEADLLSLSAHKFGGPAGVGLLAARKGVALEAVVPGHQESGRRGGTHNVPYVEALVLALESANAALPTCMPAMAALRDRLEREVIAAVPGVTVNGAGAPRLPNTSNLRFAGADGESLLIGLDLAGICISSGAACASGSITPSHVLTAMGLTAIEAHESLRLSLGRTSTAADVEAVVGALHDQVARARAAA
jgi:cysteine desulfurase